LKYKGATDQRYGIKEEVSTNNARYLEEIDSMSISDLCKTSLHIQLPVPFVIAVLAFHVIWIVDNDIQCRAVGIGA